MTSSVAMGGQRGGCEIVGVRGAAVAAHLATVRRLSAFPVWLLIYCAFAAANLSATLFQLMMDQMFLMYSARAGPYM